jgi:penicillin-binding protein 1C
VIGVALWLALAAVFAVPAVPTFESVRGGFRASDQQILDRHGEVIHELRVDPAGRRLRWVPLEEISPALQAAVVASEDRRFHAHRGIDYRAIIAAGLERVRGGGRGASTISMQLAALLDRRLRRIGGPRTLSQKWRQLRAARALDARWSKAQILEAYLNLVTFRGEVQGVEASAALLYGKAPHGLSTPEATVLAALIRAPNATTAEVIRRARGLGLGSDVATATAERALGAPPGIRPRVALAPHAAARLRAFSPDARATTERSTLDAGLQRVALESLRRHVLGIRGQNVHDGAVLVADNRTGEVLAYVGGTGPLSSAAYVDGIIAPRQAGSVLKPFLYALAFEERLLTPASLLDDSPLDVSVARGLYRPRNYDNAFRGLVSARTALAASLNVPAVKALELLGADRLVARLRKLGFDGLVEAGDFYGPALALGSADVSLWELVTAYRALAREGLWSLLVLVPGSGIHQAGVGRDTRPPARGPAGSAGFPRRVLTAQAAFLVADILADREGRSATFGLENPLGTPFWTAVKTGTSKDMRDNWCVGFSRRYTAGVWVGNSSGAPMHNVSGIAGAAPVWLDVMTWLHRAEPSRPPAPPPGVVHRTVRFPDDVEPARAELFLAGTEPVVDAPVLAGARPRILAPAPGTLIAIDPDIPPSRQRLAFASQAGTGLRWALDAVDLGPADQHVLWQPTPGRHTLALVDRDRVAVDTVTFEVR